jgi:hypothetical protein
MKTVTKTTMKFYESYLCGDLIKVVKKFFGDYKFENILTDTNFNIIAETTDKLDTDFLEKYMQILDIPYELTITKKYE